MPWIKFDLATIDKPEVLEMADLLETTSDDVIGKLLRVWGWFDQQSRDGNAGSVTGNVLKRFIDRLVGSQGFASCMEKVGWLNDSGLPNFERHNGESTKKRALTADRVHRSRNAKSNAASVTKALPDKIREESKEQATPPDGGPVWRESLTILTEQGLGEKTARGFLGLLCRDYEEVEIVDAVKSAVGKADAKAYILGVLKTRPKKGEREIRRLAV